MANDNFVTADKSVESFRNVVLLKNTLQYMEIYGMVEVP